MAAVHEKFKILLCGSKEQLAPVIGRVLRGDEVHVLYTSAVNFLISRAMFNQPHLVLLNVDGKNVDASETVREFRAEFPSVPLFVVSVSAGHQEIVGFIRAGAEGFYLLPQDGRHFEEALRTSVDRWRATEQQKRFTTIQQAAYDFGKIIGKSDGLMATLKRAKTVIENPAITVLLRGETGTGKELLARAIHYNSANSASPFVDIGCSALPETLLESELFGFEKGAFTDARERKIGLFELAGNGTIFLDEIGDISAATQSKLLKVIETRTMRRLGGLKDLPVKARIIAATSVDLETKVREGVFRKDLYHRLKIVPLELPPLRERSDDLPMLIDVFIRHCNDLYQKNIRGVSHEAMKTLAAYPWPGNIRELHHCIERAVLLEEGAMLTGAHFDLEEITADAAPAGHVDSGEGGETYEFRIPRHAASMQNIQFLALKEVMRSVEGNKSKAAQILGISRPRIDRILAKNDDM